MTDQATSSFTFLDPGPLVDGDLELVLVNRYPGEIDRGFVPAYEFEMRPTGERTGMGLISLRVGATAQIQLYAGHIGYSVKPAFRGHRYAARSCCLLLPLAGRHHIDPLWITCNPDNMASRRTCEILGCELVETVPVPPHNILYQKGDRQKCRYRISPPLDPGADG